MEGWTDVRTDGPDIMVIKPKFLASLGYHIFLTMVLCARAHSACAELGYDCYITGLKQLAKQGKDEHMRPLSVNFSGTHVPARAGQ